jgi:RecA/RadA recombinase
MAEDDAWVNDMYLSCECGEVRPVVVLYIDTEGKLDFEWAKALGVNLEQMIYERPAYGEAALDVLRESIKTGAVDVIVFDSLANLAMSAEVDASMQNDHMATTAKKLNSVMRQLPGLIQAARQDHGVEITIFTVQQVREKIGLFGGHTMFGGHGQKFAALTILKWDKAKGEVDEFFVGSKDKHESMGVSIATVLSPNCQKNSNAGTQGMSTQFRLMQQNDGILRKGEVDDYDLVWKYGKACELIARPVNSDKGWEVLGRTFRTEPDLKLALHHLPDFKHELEREIIRRMMDDWMNFKALLEGNSKKKA